MIQREIEIIVNIYKICFKWALYKLLLKNTRNPQSKTRKCAKSCLSLGNAHVQSQTTDSWWGEGLRFKSSDWSEVKDRPGSDSAKHSLLFLLSSESVRGWMCRLPDLGKEWKTHQSFPTNEKASPLTPLNCTYTNYNTLHLFIHTVRPTGTDIKYVYSHRNNLLASFPEPQWTTPTTTDSCESIFNMCHNCANPLLFICTLHCSLLLTLLFSNTLTLDLIIFEHS